MDERIHRAIDEESRNSAQPSTCRGRVPNQRSQYLTSHPKQSTHCRVLRTNFHNMLPNIVGPWFPHRDDLQKQNIYFASMLALLRPWRQLSQLKSKDRTWETEFGIFVQSTSQ